MGENVEVWVRTLLVFEWIGVCHEVTADAVGMDDSLHSYVLV